MGSEVETTVESTVDIVYGSGPTLRIVARRIDGALEDVTLTLGRGEGAAWRPAADAAAIIVPGLMGPLVAAALANVVGVD